MKIASALIYESVSLKRISLKVPPKLKAVDLFIFKCALETARKNKVILDSLAIKKIDPDNLSIGSSYVFFQTVARSAKISIGHKSCLALALCAEKNFLLVSTDPCIINIAAASDIAHLHL